MTYIPLDEQKQIFAKNLQKYIGISGKEQKQICTDLGIKERTFSQWVNGLAIPRDISTIRKIADYFNVGLTKLTDPDLEDGVSTPDIGRALEFISRYDKADPTVRSAVRTLLGLDQPTP